MLREGLDKDLHKTGLEIQCRINLLACMGTTATLKQYVYCMMLWIETFYCTVVFKNVKILNV